MAATRGNDVDEAGSAAGEGEEEHVQLHKAAEPAICEWRAASVGVLRLFSVVWCEVARSVRQTVTGVKESASVRASKTETERKRERERERERERAVCGRLSLVGEGAHRERRIERASSVRQAVDGDGAGAEECFACPLAIAFRALLPSLVTLV